MNNLLDPIEHSINEYLGFSTKLPLESSSYENLKKTLKTINVEPKIKDITLQQIDYINSVYNSGLKITNVLNDLDLIISYLSLGEKPSSISGFQNVKYHAEVYYHKISTMRDVLLSSANAVYKFGITPRNINWTELDKNLPENCHLRNLLNQFYSDNKNLIEKRQFSSHRALFNEGKAEKAMDRYLELHKSPYIKPIKPYQKKYIEEKILDFQKAFVLEIETKKSKIETFVTTFFAELASIFSIKLNSTF